MIAAALVWLCVLVGVGYLHHRWRRWLARQEFAAHLAELTAAAGDRVARYEIRGVELHAIQTIHEAQMSDAEADEMQRRLAFGLVAPAMARRFKRPAPEQARA